MTTNDRLTSFVLIDSINFVTGSSNIRDEIDTRKNSDSDQTNKLINPSTLKRRKFEWKPTVYAEAKRYKNISSKTTKASEMKSQYNLRIGLWIGVP